MTKLRRTHMVEVRRVTWWGSCAAVILLGACSSPTHPGPAQPEDTGKPTPKDSGSDSVSVSDSDSDSDSDSADGGVDTGPIVFETCEQPPPVGGTIGPATSLKDAGLYRDFDARTLKSCWVEFTPKYTLWSDGLVKKRWIWLPPGTKVDVTNMDRWTFPVGTRVFKEFALPSGQLVETRLIERTTLGYQMGSYVWKEDGTDATYHEDGVKTTVILNPTAPTSEQQTHDVPSNPTCHRCHDGETGKLLGFSAIQLSKPLPGINLKGLAARGYNPIDWKNDPPTTDTGTDFPIPGKASEAAAFGGWHANCGHCHNSVGEAGSIVTMRLRVSIIDGVGGVPTVSTDDIKSSTVDVDLQFPTVTPGYTKRVVLGVAGTDKSGVYYRDSLRNVTAQMPPIATKLVNAPLLTTLKAWIEE